MNLSENFKKPLDFLVFGDYDEKDKKIQKFRRKMRWKREFA